MYIEIIETRLGKYNSRDVMQRTRNVITRNTIRQFEYKSRMKKKTRKIVSINSFGCLTLLIDYSSECGLLSKIDNHRYLTVYSFRIIV